MIEDNVKQVLGELPEGVRLVAAAKTRTAEEIRRAIDAGIEIIDTHEDYGTTCRTVRTHVNASGREGGGVYRLCLADDDTWQFAPRRRQQPGE